MPKSSKAQIEKPLFIQFFLRYKEYVLILVALIVISGISYFNFQEYSPKVLRQIKDVKDTESVTGLVLPYPKDSQKVSVDKTADTEQTTFEARKTPAEIKEFYNTVMSEKGWEVESESISDESTVTKYKKDDKLVSVIAFAKENSENSLVSIEITSR